MRKDVIVFGIPRKDMVYIPFSKLQNLTDRLTLESDIAQRLHLFIDFQNQDWTQGQIQSTLFEIMRLAWAWNCQINCVNVNPITKTMIELVQDLALER